ncbi:MAG: DEAD/DEAH box helicase, partial [Proteobacteria bacterium]|nr:DEAD/DEAH box helicase [Pseudomonadota bacterium]
MNFKSFNLHSRVQAGVESEGYDTPTPIQVKAIGPVMEGRDVMGLAETGSGKTAAFVLPILHRLMEGNKGRPRALVVAPTRELAEQIHQAVESLGRHTRTRSMTVYGGVSINPQMLRMRRGVDVVVGCPGRLLDHLNRGTLDVSGVEILVLDEAD